MPICCRCNASGCCINCSCKTSGKVCIDCLPCRHGRCENLPRGQQSVADRHLTSGSTRSTSPTISEHSETHESTGENNTVTSPEIIFNHETTNEEPRGNHEGSQENSPDLSLPPYPQVHESSFTWGNVDGNMFTHLITCCYNEVVHWKRNLFKIPSGKAGIAYIKETSRLIRAYADSSALEAVALKAAMVMPHLLLQKSHRTSKTKDHIAQLHRRLKTWTEGDINQLLLEGRTIQKQLPQGITKNHKAEEQTSRTFAKLMTEGKVKAALRLITNQEKGGTLPLDGEIQVDKSTTKTVRDILLEKHPPACSSSLCGL